MSDLSGLTFKDLPEGSVPLEAVLLVKLLDKNGKVRYAETTTRGLTSTEALGMVTSCEASLKSQLVQSIEHF